MMRLLIACAGMLAILFGPACSEDSDPEMRGGDAFGNAGSGGGGNGDGTGSNGLGNGSGSTVTLGDGCAAVSQGTNNTLQPADIVWAIDNSCSMGEEILAVRDNMNAFSQQISDSGIDARFVLISDTFDPDVMTGASGAGGGGGGGYSYGVCIDPPLGSGSCPDDTNLDGYLHVPQVVGSWDSLDMIITTHGQWGAQMRPNATKSFVVVTDDNAVGGFEDLGGLIPGLGTMAGGNTSAAAFSTNLVALDPSFADFAFHGIYSFTQCPAAAAVGQVYADLVQQTGGIAGDLCLQQFQPVFDQIAQGVIGNSRIDCEWAIPAPPQGETLALNSVNVQYTAPSGTTENIFHVQDQGACAGGDGWFYDVAGDNPSKVLVCPSTCQRIQGEGGGAVDVLFGCGTVERPE